MKLTKQLLAISMASMAILIVLSCADSTKQEPPVAQNQSDSCYQDHPNNEMKSIIIYKESISAANLDSLKKFGLTKTWSCPCDSNLQLWGDSAGVSIYGHDGVANNGRNQPGGAGGVNDIINLGFNASPNYYTSSGDITIAIDTKYLEPFGDNYDSTNLIGVMDTGIQSQGNLWINTNDNKEDSIDNDHNGFINDFQGWNFVNKTNQIGAAHHHGTFVKYLIERELKGKRKYGIVPMKVLHDDNTGKLTDMLCAMAYATKIPNLKTLNASLGYYGHPSQILMTMIEKLKGKGIMLVTAAGNADPSDSCEVVNGKKPRDLANRKHKFYPASYGSTFTNIIVATTIYRYKNKLYVCRANQNYSNQYVNVGVMGDSSCNFVFKFSKEEYNVIVNTIEQSWGTSYASPVAAAFSFLRQTSPLPNEEARILSSTDIRTNNYRYRTVPPNLFVKRGVLVR